MRLYQSRNPHPRPETMTGCDNVEGNVAGERKFAPEGTANRQVLSYVFFSAAFLHRQSHPIQDTGQQRMIIQALH